tara:strand:- start:232 stop:957 length:726 start_codon:yes stop_codon:yes gene_type:complete
MKGGRGHEEPLLDFESILEIANQGDVSVDEVLAIATARSKEKREREERERTRMINDGVSRDDGQGVTPEETGKPVFRPPSKAALEDRQRRKGVVVGTKKRKFEEIIDDKLDKDAHMEGGSGGGRKRGGEGDSGLNNHVEKRSRQEVGQERKGEEGDEKKERAEGGGGREEENGCRAEGGGGREEENGCRAEDGKTEKGNEVSLSTTATPIAANTEAEKVEKKKKKKKRPPSAALLSFDMEE